jgi:gentisate 1,2-dioxygenase
MDAIDETKNDKSHTLSSTLRQALHDAHMVPLWESPTAHKPDVAREQAHIWPWRQTRPILMAAAALRSPKVVERRVISLVNPKSRSPEDETTAGATISGALQLLLPGESARPHRHSMSALRFVIEGEGAETIVDGKRCPMLPGDLIITPAWCWHEHTAQGTKPTIWLDVLDVALHLFLGTDEFQPGPVRDVAQQYSDAAFSVVGIVPGIAAGERSYSPYFRYPWQDVVKALQASPKESDGSRRARYVNPLNGDPVMPLLDCVVFELEPSKPTQAFRSSASTLCCVVEGRGTSEIGGKTITWEPLDLFTVPHGAWASHCAESDSARIFTVSNREVYRRLGLLTETYKD